MPASLTDTLCTSCGLCCDGSLFAEVELGSRAEVSALEILGLDVEDHGASGGLLSQPCAALAGSRCTIYAHRPGCCRTFECRLLQDARRGSVSVVEARALIADALEQIRRVKELLAKLGEADARLPLVERCAEALARDRRADPVGSRTRAALESAMARVEKLLRERFLTTPIESR